jgi:hypothetical protein
MSRMSEIAMEIEDLILVGNLSNEEIAKVLNVPIEWVESTEKGLVESGDIDDSMDGDHESALASAGWGTDEDYGYYGDGNESF